MKRLPVNLATEPLERRRLRRRIVAITALVVLVVTAAQGLAIRSLLAGDGTAGAAGSATTGAVAEPSEAAAAQVRAWERQVERIAAVAVPERVRATAEAVEVANDVIARRAFPWGELFAALEGALPDDVRLAQVQPAATTDGVRVELVATARERAGLMDFLEALEGVVALRDVFPVLQERSSEGEWRLTVRARYAGPAAGEERP